MDVFSYESVVERCMGDDVLAQRLLFRFVDQLDNDLREIRNAVAFGDAKRVKSIANRLRGAASNLGIDLVHRAAADVDELAATGDLMGAGPLVDELDAAGETFRRDLQLWSEVQNDPHRLAYKGI